LIKLVIENVEYSATIESMSDEELQQSINQDGGTPARDPKRDKESSLGTVCGPLAVPLPSVSPPNQEGPQYEPYLEPEKKDARARARRPSGARSRAEKTFKVVDDPFEYVCLNTHLWRALEKYRSSIGQAMPKFIHRGTGEHANHTGTYFRKSELAAASKAGHDPPPALATDEDQSSEGDDEQFTAGLRRV
jgi:hypothetical protein